MLSYLRQRLLPKSVANTSSQLRDHLTNERTSLAWARTGIAFAAMALALGRLDVFYHMLATAFRQNSITHTLNLPDVADEPASSCKLTPAEACHGVSVWSFGYGLFRYVTVKHNLMTGQFVPAMWGPVIVTAGSLAVFAMLKRASSFQLKPQVASTEAK